MSFLLISFMYEILTNTEGSELRKRLYLLFLFSFFVCFSFLFYIHSLFLPIQIFLHLRVYNGDNPNAKSNASCSF